MTKLKWALLFVALTATPALADTAEELDKWFRDGYAALYIENSWDHADEFAQYFADVITYQSDDGRTDLDINGFVLDNFDEWRSEGWLGSDVAAMDTQLLNATTAVFDIKWKDRNADGSTGYECGWYVADKIDGKWLLSQYISRPNALIRQKRDRRNPISPGRRLGQAGPACIDWHPGTGLCGCRLLMRPPDSRACHR